MPNQPVPQSETRTITVSPNIIRHLISSQAGSLGKAVAECVMNAIDAHASKVEINIRPDGFTVADDGHGLRTRDEVLACFEVLGFDHNDRERDFGKFGLGRAQLWNWCKTSWRTREFRLDVDVREKGFDYDLVSGLPDEPGLRIEGVFYERLSETARTRLLREIDDLCRYCVIAVVVDGRNIRRDPSGVKWTHEDDDAWIKVTDAACLSIYNQGVLVRDYGAYDVGIGGVLVTKPGHNLALNMARSDILTHECEVWKRLRKVCAGLGKKAVDKKKTRMTDDQRDFLASQTADVEGLDNFKLPLFTLTNGRSVALDWLTRRLYADQYLTMSEPGDRLAERAIAEQSAVVLTERTLGRFGTSSVRELVATLQARIEAAHRAGRYEWSWAASTLAKLARENRIFDRFADCPVSSMLEASTLPEKSWKKPHRAIVAALQQYERRVASCVADQTGAERNNAGRRIVVGQSNAAEAFTDGSTYIAYNETVLDAAIKDGLPGTMRLVALMVHELIHDENDAGSHQHDPQFHETFHEVMLNESATIYQVGFDVFREFCRRQDRLNARLAKDADAARMTLAA